MAADQRTQRAARRQFIRDHHPDRGGDTDAFITGLSALDVAAGHPVGLDAEIGAEDGYHRPIGRIVVVAHRNWLRRTLAAVSHLVHRTTTPPRVH